MEHIPRVHQFLEKSLPPCLIGYPQLRNVSVDSLLTGSQDAGYHYQAPDPFDRTTAFHTM